MTRTPPPERFEGRSSEMRPDSPWLSSEDIAGLGDVPATIAGCFRHRDVTFDDGRTETVFALAFEGKKKQLVLNSTNRKALVAAFGTDVREWAGKRIKLHVVEVMAFGEKTTGIRVKT